MQRAAELKEEKDDALIAAALRSRDIYDWNEFCNPYGNSVIR